MAKRRQPETSPEHTIHPVPRARGAGPAGKRARRRVAKNRGSRAAPTAAESLDQTVLRKSNNECPEATPRFKQLAYIQEPNKPVPIPHVIGNGAQDTKGTPATSQRTRTAAAKAGQRVAKKREIVQNLIGDSAAKESVVSAPTPALQRAGRGAAPRRPAAVGAVDQQPSAGAPAASDTRQLKTYLRRQSELLTRIDDNLRRLRDIAESRGTSFAVFSEPMY